MLARLLLLILPWVAFAPSALSQSIDPQIAFHLRMVKLDPSAEAAIWPYLSSAATTEGISVTPFEAGVSPSEVLRQAGAAGRVEILTDPNILAKNGQEASFLSGSSFPIPNREPGSDRLSITWQAFGIRLDLLPTVKGGGIALRVASEVSFLDYVHAITTYGFSVPGVSRRRNVTAIDLADGQSFAISGLVDRDLVEALSKLPGLADMAVLRDIAASGVAKVLMLVTPEVQSR
jgi:pilus assembly protein CpaC